MTEHDETINAAGGPSRANELGVHRLPSTVRSRAARRCRWMMCSVIILSAIPAAANPSRDGWGFGIADDSSPGVFAGANFQRLHARVLRFQVPYDVALPGYAWIKQQARDRIAAARAAGVQQVMITFRQKQGEWPPWGANQPTRPEPATWASLVESFVNEFDADVALWGVANEPNAGLGWLKLDGRNQGDTDCLRHGDGAQKLAGYYRALEDILRRRGSSSKLVGPEWHDDVDGNGNANLASSFHPGTTESTVKHYIDHYRACGGDFGNFIGWHPYGGVKYKNLSSTRDLLRATPDSIPVLITEVGSVLRGNGESQFRFSEIEQSSQVSWIVNDLASLDGRISRIYYYHVLATPAPQWDSGLEYADGTPRLAWYQYCRAHVDGQCDVPGVFPEGTFIRTPNGTVYRSAGHSPVQLFTCARQGYYPGCGSFWQAPQEYVDNLRVIYPVPVDGTFVQRSDGTMFRFAGGAPVTLYDCGPLGGCPGFVSLDGEAVNRLIQRQSIPREGTLLRRPDGAVFQMRCGRATYVSNCADVGGCAGLVDVDGVALDRLATLPGCQDDQNSCTDEVCSAGECTHPFGAHCLAPIMSLLMDDVSSAVCGNRTVEVSEQCDDGNTRSGDCCSATCTFESTSTICGPGCGKHCDGAGVCR